MPFATFVAMPKKMTGALAAADIFQLDSEPCGRLGLDFTKNDLFPLKTTPNRLGCGRLS
jgi:hypothetical protein